MSIYVWLREATLHASLSLLNDEEEFHVVKRGVLILFIQFRLEESIKINFDIL